MRSLILIVCAFALAACAGATANVPPAMPKDYRLLIAAKLRETLKDPWSVRNPQIAEPTPMWVGLVHGGSVPVICVKLFAKNSFGAYEGAQTYGFTFQGGIAPVQVPTLDGCETVAYTPFPELAPPLPR